MAEAERPDRPPPPSPLDILRDRRALVDTGLGPVAFVTVNAVAGLETAAIVAVAISVVIALFRAVRREPLTNAVGYMARHIDTFRKAREIVASGAMGRLIHLQSTMYVAQLFRTGRALLPFDADFLAFLDSNGQVKSSAREVPASGSQPSGAQTSSSGLRSASTPRKNVTTAETIISTAANA